MWSRSVPANTDMPPSRARSNETAPRTCQSPGGCGILVEIITGRNGHGVGLSNLCRRNHGKREGLSGHPALPDRRAGRTAVPGPTGTAEPGCNRTACDLSGPQCTVGGGGSGRVPPGVCPRSAGAAAGSVPAARPAPAPQPGAPDPGAGRGLAGPAQRMLF